MVLGDAVITDRIGQSQAVQVRNATSADLASVIDLHTVAFPDFPTTHLGRRFMTAFYGAFLNTPADLFRVAQTADGAIVGFAAGSIEPRAHHQRFYGTHLPLVTWVALRRIVRHPTFVVPLLLRVPRLMDAILSRARGEAHAPGTAQHNDERTLTLLFLVIAQEARSGGIGRQMVADVEKQAAVRHCTLIELDTDVRNEPAQLFFERLGFVPEDAGSIVRFRKPVRARRDD